MVVFVIKRREFGTPLTDRSSQFLDLDFTPGFAAEPFRSGGTAASSTNQHVEVIWNTISVEPRRRQR